MNNHREKYLFVSVTKTLSTFLLFNNQWLTISFAVFFFWLVLPIISFHKRGLIGPINCSSFHQNLSIFCNFSMDCFIVFASFNAWNISIRLSIICLDSKFSIRDGNNPKSELPRSTRFGSLFFLQRGHFLSTLCSSFLKLFTTNSLQQLSWIQWPQR